jgi:hypothetical protein
VTVPPVTAKLVFCAPSGKVSSDASIATANGIAMVLLPPSPRPRIGIFVYFAW